MNPVSFLFKISKNYANVCPCYFLSPTQSHANTYNLAYNNKPNKQKKNCTLTISSKMSSYMSMYECNYKRYTFIYTFVYMPYIWKFILLCK